MTQPEAVLKVHTDYLEAGADIIETNTFNGQTLSQSDYNLSEIVLEINQRASELAREAADKFSTEERWRLVAGAVGPTPRTCSVSPDVDDASFRNTDFDECKIAYKEQIHGLVLGGCHIIFIETIFDTLNAKAGIAAYIEFFEENGLEKLPLFISGTMTDRAGRTLSGQTVEAFYYSMMHADPYCIGLNCALGADIMLPFFTRLACIATCYVHAYPNAGLPNEMGGYDETGSQFAHNMTPFIDAGINMIGACCGSTHEFIKEVADICEGKPTRERLQPHINTTLSGMEDFVFYDDMNFVNIGERCNLSGSAQFKKMIKKNDWEKATSVAKKQVQDGAQLLDINLDDGLIDGV